LHSHRKDVELSIEAKIALRHLPLEPERRTLQRLALESGMTIHATATALEELWENGTAKPTPAGEWLRPPRPPR
jgi:hypothetical protein